MKALLFSLLTFGLIAASSPLLAQGFSPLPTGGRMAALGQAYTAMSGDLWTQFANPAGLAGLEAITVGAAVDRRFGLAQLNSGQAALGWALPGQQGLGLYLGRAGWEAWRENRAGLSYGIEVLERLRLGAGLEWKQVSIINYGALNVLQVSAGVQLDINSELTLGVSARNLNQAGNVDANGIRYQTISQTSVGLQYRPSSTVQLSAEAYVEPGYEIGWRTGLEYLIGDLLYLRLGGGIEPLFISGGLGLNWQHLQLDLATQYTALLGYSPTLSVNYAFGDLAQD